MAVTDKVLNVAFDLLHYRSSYSLKMSQTLKHQEFTVQEQLRKRFQVLDSARKEADMWRSKCEELDQNMITQDRTLEHIMGCVVRSTIRSLYPCRSSSLLVS